MPLFCLVKLNTNIPYNSAILLLDTLMHQDTFTRIFTAALYITAKKLKTTEEGSINMNG